ncbi:MAG: bis(5'-nucleosyl)-tetraphosphatase (symmetrical) YqeK [Terrisporobacter othiniensis]|uniref:bis(5'-nucleosyl)-tetraphosphatase (symmetrical) n=1 Tax=Terrisporobacter hibernicus TaxID=2813371 RepID=A0AAX2ZCK4_9FIRM|nr:MULTISPECIES: bis(5'-nucleosyl)-tetraphosphatase (symmetrical) YqeK [Terrisporobacter]MDU4860046.1 bis(5'-nucleosyl)-tetraphosphatase (symmetrical) YqeK [Terrisporobacter othiniensis]MDU6994364.1 bis(5'-nucleosyl)-tetraphosphatase (symmetrical) YqeK [Terrisporobacter othiniensis]UEL46541.1 bis(5'-nucleosyl)-tetraphosphatase (symmetrical) YqeK [Terrisporobacter hibernicus]SFI96247.1 putative HD superfamily hydrolase of NAD metabolism [Terrisporobacter glycolicus]
MDIKQIEKTLKGMLPERRLKHSLNVSKCAVKLSEIYKCDKEKAEIAGLVHDCAKYFTDEQIEDSIKRFNVELDPLEVNNIALSHSVIGSYVAVDIFSIKDEEIINAIKYHTTGKENMSLLEKIIYMADLIEEDRNFPRVEELRELTYSGKLEEALLLSFNNTIKFVIDNNQLIHPRTIKARNYILEELIIGTFN